MRSVRARQRGVVGWAVEWLLWWMYTLYGLRWRGHYLVYRTPVAVAWRPSFLPTTTLVSRGREFKSRNQQEAIGYKNNFPSWRDYPHGPVSLPSNTACLVLHKSLLSPNECENHPRIWKARIQILPEFFNLFCRSFLVTQIQMAKCAEDYTYEFLISGAQKCCGIFSTKCSSSTNCNQIWTHARCNS